MAIKKNDPTADKNDSTSDKGAKATNDSPSTETSTAKNDAIAESNAAEVNRTASADADKGTDTGEMTIHETDKVVAARDTSDVGTGDVANTEETREKIAENKDGRKIADAPTEDAPLVVVTETEAKNAVRMGRPIPGVDLKPGDRPDVATTRPSDVLQAGGVGYARQDVGDGRGPRTKRTVNRPSTQPGERVALNVRGSLNEVAADAGDVTLTPTANYRKE